MMKKYFKLIIKILCMSVYSVLAMELFLRVFAPVPMLPRYVCSTDFGIRGNEPNKEYWHKTPEYRVHIMTNSKGIRSDREISYEKPQGIKRIVLLGDSFGMGYGVNLEDTFASQLVKYLNEQGDDVEIVNLSVSGHGNAEELIMLKNEGFRYDPDLVLLQWHSTDIQDNVRSGLFKIDADGKLVPKNTTYLPGVEVREMLFKIRGYRFLAEHSQFYNFFREWAAKKVKKILVTVRGNNEEAANDPDAKAIAQQKQEQLTLYILKEIQDQCRQHDASFLVLDIPRPIGRLEFYSIFPKQNDASFNLNYYCPIPDFLEYSGQKIYWEKSHGHLTPLGCEIVGRGLGEYIIEHKLLD